MGASFHKGYGYIVDPGSDGIIQEKDSITCIHCNKVEFLAVGAMPPFCRRCMKPVCEACHADGRCRPFQEWLEKVEAKARTAEMLKRLGI